MDRYDLAAQSANALWDWDLTTSRIHYSSGWISMLGDSGNEVSSTTDEWFRRIHPEDFELVQKEIRSHLATGSAQFEVQHRMLHADGGYRWMACRGVITRDSTGRAIRISGCHLDITAEKVVDKLTGLPNRLLLEDRLARAVETAAKRNDFQFALFIVELDLFRTGVNRLETVNSDSLLIAAARRMEITLKAEAGSDGAGYAYLVARSGGEEFIILLEALASPGEAKRVADIVLKRLQAPFQFDGREVFLSPNIGIALSATGYRTAEEALRDADTALYRAKSFGKSRCEVFDTAVLQTKTSREDLEKELQTALDRKEFEVYYQPIVSLSTNRIVGLEALVRWNHPEKGLVFPKDFIPLSEETGLIIPLDRWVLGDVCRQLKAWKDNPALPADLWVSVNLSGAQLKDPSLIDAFRAILLESGIDAAKLMLELTEGSVMENPESARSLIMQLRVMGARIGLDDFGTGYSSLSHLRRFPLDFLKIDHSFVKSIGISDTVEIIRAITAMSRQLGLRVIAEGIENVRQLDMLRSLECEYGQGFLCSRAVTSGEVEKLLMNGTGFQLDADGDEAKACSVSVLISCAAARAAKACTSSLAMFRRKRNTVPAAEELPEAMPERVPHIRRKYVLIALPIIILLIMGGALAKLNQYTAPPTVYTAPPAPVSAAQPVELPAEPAPSAESVPPVVEPQAAPLPAEPPKPKTAPKTAAQALPAKTAAKPAVVHNAPVEKAEKPAPPEPAPSQQAQELAARIQPRPPAPKPVPANPAPFVYTLSVLHDHRIGNCTGLLKVTESHVSFLSEKSKDSFDAKHSEYSWSLEKDQLVIKTGGRTYRFKSAIASNRDQNLAQLMEAFDHIQTQSKRVSN